MEGAISNGPNKHQALPEDFSSSYSSYSDESDQERVDFIAAAKRFISERLDQEIQQEDKEINGSDEDLADKGYDFDDQGFYYNGQKIDGIPEWMHGMENFAAIMKQNSQQILNSLNQQDKERLHQFLPQQVKDKDRLLGQILRGDKIGFMNQNPVEQFGLKLQNNVFTTAHNQYSEYKKELQIMNRIQQVKENLKYIENLRKTEIFKENNQINELLNQLIAPVRRQTQDYLSSSDEDSSEDLSEEEKELYNEIHAQFEDLTSGYTTISSNKGEFSNFKKTQSSLVPAGTSQLNPLSFKNNAFGQRTEQIQIQKQGQQSNEQSLIKTSDPSKSSIKKSSLISLNTKDNKDSSSKTKKTVPYTPQQENSQPFSDPKLLEQIMNSERFKNLKVHKNQVTLSRPSSHWIEMYRRQEEERYRHPTRPWVYFNEDGTTSIVGPVIKKKSQQTNQKPRDHPQLHSNRPAIVTLLCLARDAASRLPDGIGTRADILELIKQSKWLKTDGTDPNQLNNIVSGALDRLHYEEDPCVKYDSERKLWIYLHKNRTLDWPDWTTSYNERPNALENNSFNPYIGTDREDLWKNTPHRERSQSINYRFNTFEDNDNSASVDATKANQISNNVISTSNNNNNNNNNNKIIVKIPFKKDAAPKTTGHKRSFHSKSANEYDEFGEIKPKRQKY